MKCLELDPIDVLYFRNSKPFAKGEEHFSTSLFPPYPSTLYGALRTLILRQNDIFFDSFYKGNIENDLKKLVGTPDSIGSLTINGLFLQREETIYLSSPADLVFSGNDIEKEFHILKLKKNFFSSVSSGFEYLPFISKYKYKPLTDSFLSVRNLQHYLMGNTDFVKNGIQSMSDIIKKDKRVGIGIDNDKNVTKEGQLFLSESVEFEKNWNFLAWINDTPFLQDHGYLNWGGKSKPVLYKKADKGLFSFVNKTDIMEKIQETGVMKLLFLTPTILNEGWISSHLKIDSAKLVSAAINKVQKIGGFDIAKKKPKTMYNVLPAGSVFYYELADKSEGNIENIFQKFYLKNISDIYPNMGFGLTILGGF